MEDDLDLEMKAVDSKMSAKKPGVHNVKAFKNHDCQKSSQCRPDWDILGCIMLYKLKKIEERVELMKENQLCFKCGSSFKRIRNKTHLCSWKNGKNNARCTVPKCGSAAATCRYHNDNASQELKDWLGRNNTKFIAEVVFASPPHVNCEASLNLNKAEAKEFMDFLTGYNGPFEEGFSEFYTQQKNKQSPV